VTQLTIGVGAPSKHFSVDCESGLEIFANIDLFEHQSRGEKQLAGNLFN
jgi:hypothetical protein